VKTVRLTPFRISNGALAARDLPPRLKLLDWGRNQTVKGTVVVNETTAQALPLNQARRGFDRVALDYEHNTVPGTPEFTRTREPREVAAYGVPVVVPGEGLFLEQAEYTPSGRQHARNYIDLSPAPELNERGEVVFLHSAALCRQGAVEGLTFFSVEVAEGSGATGENSEEEKALMDKVMALLRKALGLKDDAGEDQIVAAVQGVTALSARLEAIEGQMKPLVALTAADGTLTVLSTGVDTLKADLAGLKDGKAIETLQGQVAGLSAALDGVRREILCHNARLQGKVIPLTAEQIAKSDLATLSAMIEKLPAGEVPLVALSAGAIQAPGAAGAGVLTEADKRVALACGLDPANVAKANGLKG
jgi:phage I-like protein